MTRDSSTVYVERLSSLDDLMRTVDNLRDADPAVVDMQALSAGTYTNQLLLAALGNVLISRPPGSLDDVLVPDEDKAVERFRQTGLDAVAHAARSRVELQTPLAPQQDMLGDNTDSSRRAPPGRLFWNPHRNARTDWSFAASSMFAQASRWLALTSHPSINLLSTVRESAYLLSENLAHAELTTNHRSYICIDTSTEVTTVVTVDNGVGIMGSLASRAPTALIDREDAFAGLFEGKFTYGAQRGRGLMTLASIVARQGGTIEAMTCEDPISQDTLLYRSGKVETIAGLGIKGTIVSVTCPVD